MLIFYFYVNCKELKILLRWIANKFFFFSISVLWLFFNLRNFPLFPSRPCVSLEQIIVCLLFPPPSDFTRDKSTHTRVVRRNFVVTCFPSKKKCKTYSLFACAHETEQKRDRQNNEFPFSMAMNWKSSRLIRIDPAESAICFFILAPPPKKQQIIVLLTDIHVT